MRHKIFEVEALKSIDFCAFLVAPLALCEARLK